MTEFDVHQAGVGKKRRAESSGRRAETMCAWWLRLKGYRIVAERSRQPGGEIDLVAVRGSVLAFVEVKARASVRVAVESVSPRQQARTTRAAQSFAAGHSEFDAHTMRFDVMLVAPRRRPVHIPNAWHILD